MSAQVEQFPQAQADKQAGGPPPPAEVGFFDDDQGHRSSMRLMSVMSLVAATAFGTLTVLASVGLLGSQPGGEAVTMTFGFLIGAFAPKAVQKFAETKGR